MKPNIFKKLFSSFKKPRISHHKPILFRPLHFWKIVLSVSAILVTTSLAFGVYVFYKISTDSYMKIDHSEQTATESINRKKLESVLNRYSEKTKKFNEVEMTKPAVTDPSL